MKLFYIIAFLVSTSSALAVGPLSVSGNGPGALIVERGIATTGNTSNLWNIASINLPNGTWMVDIIFYPGGNASTTTFRCAFSTDSVDNVAEGSLNPLQDYFSLDRDFILNAGNTPGADQIFSYPTILIRKPGKYYFKVRTTGVAVTVRAKIIARLIN